MKLTPWFPASIKPVRRGWYPRDWSGDGEVGNWTRDFWSGTSWQNGYLVLGSRGGIVAKKECVPRSDQKLRWRGLTLPLQARGARL